MNTTDKTRKVQTVGIRVTQSAIDREFLRQLDLVKAVTGHRSRAGAIRGAIKFQFSALSKR